MRIVIEVRDGVVVIRSRGCSLRTGDGDVKLRRALDGLLQAGVRRAVLDLSSLRWADGGSLEELLHLGRRLAEAGARLAVVRPALRSSADLARLRGGFEMLPDLETAMGRIAGGRRVPLPGPRWTLDAILDALAGGRADLMGGLSSPKIPHGRRILHSLTNT